MSNAKTTPIKSANVNPAFREGGRVVEELKTLYYSRLLAIEREYSFAKLCGFPEILEAELEAKPLVLLLGQYSTGKTSFVKHLIGCDYPEIHIGPEPTTGEHTHCLILSTPLTHPTNIPPHPLNTISPCLL